MIWLSVAQLKARLDLKLARKPFENHFLPYLPYIQFKEVCSKHIPSNYVDGLVAYHNMNRSYPIETAALIFAATEQARFLIVQAQHELQRRIKHLADEVTGYDVAVVFDIHPSTVANWRRRGLLVSRRAHKVSERTGAAVEAALIPKSQITSCYEWKLPMV